MPFLNAIHKLDQKNGVKNIWKVLIDCINHSGGSNTEH